MTRQRLPSVRTAIYLRAYKSRHTATGEVIISAGNKNVFSAHYTLVAEKHTDQRSLYYKLVQDGGPSVWHEYGLFTRGFDKAVEVMHRQLAAQAAVALAAFRYREPKKSKETA